MRSEELEDDMAQVLYQSHSSSTARFEPKLLPKRKWLVLSAIFQWPLLSCCCKSVPPYSYQCFLLPPPPPPPSLCSIFYHSIRLSMYYINVYIIIYVYGSVDFLIVPCLLWFKRMCLLGCYWDCWPVSCLRFSVLVYHFLRNSCRLFWGVLSLCMLLKVTWHLDGTVHNSYVHHFLNLFPALEVENGGGCVYLICSEMLLQIHFTYCIVAPNTLCILYCCSKYTLVPNTLCTLYGVPNTHFKNVTTWEHICMFVNAVFPDTLCYSHGS